MADELSEIIAYVIRTYEHDYPARAIIENLMEMDKMTDPEKMLDLYQITALRLEELCKAGISAMLARRREESFSGVRNYSIWEQGGT